MIKEASHLHCHANYTHNMHGLAQKPHHWGGNMQRADKFHSKSEKKKDKEYDFLMYK